MKLGFLTDYNQEIVNFAGIDPSTLLGMMQENSVVLSPLRVCRCRLTTSKIQFICEVAF